MNTLTDMLFVVPGRISRAPWWMWKLVNGTAAILARAVFPSTHSYALVGVSIPLFAMFAWISTALDIKRFHDRNKSGWWVLVGFIPLIGLVWIIVELGCLRGTPGPNRFGECNRYG